MRIAHARGRRRPASPWRVLPVLLMLSVVVLLPTAKGFVPRPPRQARPSISRHRHQPSARMAASGSSSSSSSSSSGGYRGQARNDEEIVDLSGDGGVTKRVIRPGFGYKQETPPKHAYCKVAFVMKTGTGQVIADRMDKPMEFMLGLEKPEVIPGWELAVASMKPNEIAEVVCRSEYAFGAAEGYEDKIPPGATIVTRLQLLDWRSLKGAGSTDVQDTRELTKKWREEIDQGISPMTDWAAPPKAPRQAPNPSRPPQPQRVEDVQDLGGPLAEAQAAMDRSQQHHSQQPQAGLGDEAIAADGFTAPSGASAGPRVEEMPMDNADGPKPKVDIDDPEARKKLNPNQVVMGTGPQYRWKERPGHLELVVPVPDTVRKEDVLVHMTNRVLMVGFKTPEGKESWLVGGDLFGAIEREESFWVLSKGSDFVDELTEGKTCIEVRLEKKEPFRRIWANVFKDQ